MSDSGNNTRPRHKALIQRGWAAIVTDIELEERLSSARKFLDCLDLEEWTQHLQLGILWEDGHPKATEAIEALQIQAADEAIIEDTTELIAFLLGDPETAPAIAVLDVVSFIIAASAELGQEPGCPFHERMIPRWKQVVGLRVGLRYGELVRSHSAAICDEVLQILGQIAVYEQHLRGGQPREQELDAQRPNDSDGRSRGLAELRAHGDAVRGNLRMAKERAISDFLKCLNWSSRWKGELVRYAGSNLLVPDRQTEIHRFGPPVDQDIYRSTLLIHLANPIEREMVMRFSGKAQRLGARVAEFLSEFEHECGYDIILLIGHICHPARDNKHKWKHWMEAFFEDKGDDWCLLYYLVEALRDNSDFAC